MLVTVLRVGLAADTVGGTRAKVGTAAGVMVVAEGADKHKLVILVADTDTCLAIALRVKSATTVSIISRP